MKARNPRHVEEPFVEKRGWARISSSVEGPHAPATVAVVCRARGATSALQTHPAGRSETDATPGKEITKDSKPSAAHWLGIDLLAALGIG